MTQLRHIFLPLIMALGLLAQLSLPWVQARAAEAGFNAAPYICNLNGRAPTTEAQAHIQALLELTGDAAPEDDAPFMEHCSACIMPNIAVMVTTVTAPLSQKQFSRKASFPKTRPEIYHFAQGPPLGSRAPPAFI